MEQQPVSHAQPQFPLAPPSIPLMQLDALVAEYGALAPLETEPAAYRPESTELDHQIMGWLVQP